MGGVWVGGNYIQSDIYCETYCYTRETNTAFYCSGSVMLHEPSDIVEQGPMETVAPELLAFWSEDD